MPVWTASERLPAAAPLARATGLDPLVVSILLRRGHASPPELLSFVGASPARLQDPYAFTGMKPAVDRIRRARARGEKILVYGDYDADGVTSSAILSDCLRSLGARVDVYLPHRTGDGYGLQSSAVEGFAAKGYGLVVTADNGIAASEAVDALSARGIDTVIVDHHRPKERIPAATAIVSAAVDGRGDGNLAACGLAYKLAWALLEDPLAAERYLELAAIGTVADQAPLVGDNRILVRQGLTRLAATRRPGLRALLNAAGVFGQRVSPRDIAFGVAPRINAAGRMGTPETALGLLVTEDAAEASRLAAELEEGNRLRRAAEAAAYRQAVRQVREDEAGAGSNVIVVASPDWHEGILGILAARLVERFGRPALAITLRGGIGKGSGRSRGGPSLYERVLPHEEIFESFGGHSRAVGFSIREDRVGLLRERVNQDEPANDAGTVWSPDPEVVPETELPLGRLTSSLIDALEALGPFGEGHPRPCFLAKGVRLRGPARKGARGGVKRWVYDPSGGTTCEAVWPAGLDARETKKIQSAEGALDLLYWPVWHRAAGIASVRIEIEAWKAAQDVC